MRGRSTASLLGRHLTQTLYAIGEIMKNILLSILSLFSISACTQDLVEFSTSMGFDEFEVVVKHLQAADKPLANEIATKIEQFKNSSSPGQSRKYIFDSIPGHMILEREDEYAVGIATFTTADIQAKIETAYDQGTKELGI